METPTTSVSNPFAKLPPEEQKEYLEMFTEAKKTLHSMSKAIYDDSAFENARLQRWQRHASRAWKSFKIAKKSKARYWRAIREKGNYPTNIHNQELNEGLGINLPHMINRLSKDHPFYNNWITYVHALGNNPTYPYSVKEKMLRHMLALLKNKDAQKQYDFFSKEAMLDLEIDKEFGLEGNSPATLDEEETKTKDGLSELLGEFTKEKSNNSGAKNMK